MLSRLLCIVLGTLGSLGLAECAFRFLHLAPQVAVLTDADEDTPYIRSENPALTYVLRPNYRSGNPSNHHGRFSYVNSFGQRDIERTKSRVPGKKRILMIGDSVVAGHGEPNLDNTISRKLEREFDGAVEVLNFGVGGYNTRAEVELLREKGLQFSPDAVILVTVFNDSSNENGEPPSEYDVARPKWQKLLFIHSALFRYIALQYNLFRFQERLSGQWKLERALPIHTASARQDNMSIGFYELDRIAREHKFKVGVVVWPHLGEQDITHNYYERTERNELLVDQLISEYKLSSLHLADAFKQDFSTRCPPGAPAPCPSPNVVYSAAGDGIHANEVGASVAAKALRPFAESLLK